MAERIPGLRVEYTNDGAHPYTYDTENRLATAGGVTYTYDGDGKRVKKSIPPMTEPVGIPRAGSLFLSTAIGNPPSRIPCVEQDIHGGVQQLALPATPVLFGFAFENHLVRH